MGDAHVVSAGTDRIITANTQINSNDRRPGRRTSRRPVHRHPPGRAPFRLCRGSFGALHPRHPSGGTRRSRSRRLPARTATEQGLRTAPWVAPYRLRSTATVRCGEQAMTNRRRPTPLARSTLKSHSVGLTSSSSRRREYGHRRPRREVTPTVSAGQLSTGSPPETRSPHSADRSPPRTVHDTPAGHSPLGRRGLRGLRRASRSGDTSGSGP